MSIRKINGVVIDADTVDGLNAALAANQIPVLNADAKMALANLVDTVCSEAEADTKIGDHAGLPNVHHTKVLISSGSYTGDDSVNRAIAHGLGVAPKFVYIVKDITFSPLFFATLNGEAKIHQNISNPNAVTAPDDTNFYVGNATSYPNTANATTIVYVWVAIG